jgi:hypothetical protein
MEKFSLILNAFPFLELRKIHMEFGGFDYGN